MLFHRHFIRIAKRFGDKLAFADCTSDKKLTYSKALIAALIFSDKLKEYDAGLIGLMIPTSAGCGIAFLGALMSGRTPVMINYSTGAAANAEYAQKKCKFRTIITSKALLEKINCPVVDGMVFIETLVESISFMDRLRAAMKAALPVQWLLGSIHEGTEDDTVVILFTSGSEKDPKAVELTHKNISSNIKSFSEMFQLSDKDSMLANLPFFHVFGITINLLAPIYHGMTVIAYSNPLDYKRICAIVREHKPTMLAGTPSFLWGYLRKSEPGDFGSVRLLVSGADKCPEALQREFYERHGITVYEGYGATETSPVISANFPDNNRPGSIGKALPGVQIRIENYESGKDCTEGETGRILVKGDLVMKGYFDDFEETSMRVRHGWYDTGDMGYFDKDGFLWHAGRLKRFVKIGGEMVSLVRVENVLEKLLPSDALCCVVGIPDPIKGARIIAAVTHKTDEKKLLKEMAEQLPNIALPREFVVIPELPKMGSGKIDFRGVTDMVSNMLLSERA